MEAKSSVVKSKSSNSAKTLRSDHVNKKSRSSAEFQPYVIKKRGVYVEPTKRVNELEKNQVQERPKAPPRPKPGNKKFLASILTILSKSTTGTQYPDVNEIANKKTEKRHRKKPTIIKKLENTDVILKETVDSEVVKPKRKFKSKALNSGVNKETDKFIVLQSQKDVIQTPSIYSENDSLNWSNMPALVKRVQRHNQEVEKKTDGVACELAKEIMEGLKSRSEKRVRIDEPKTLVAETKNEPKVNDEADKQTKGNLYNFFVDLLETTISVYNVKEEYDKVPAAHSVASSTKMPLEINESVAKKLNEPCEKVDQVETISQPSSHFVCLKDLEYGHVRSEYEPKHEMQARPARKKRYKAEPFSFVRKPVTKKMKTESVIETKTSFSKKDKKRNLLNLIKEQLRMDDDTYEEPQNLYQALKVIAQNKKRCQKTIHFEEARLGRKKDYGFPECMYKRRKVISSSTKGSKKNHAPSIAGKVSEVSGRTRGKSESESEEEHESYHSLEVYGYDYETPAMRKAERLRSTCRQRDLLFTYHSTPSYSERTIGSREMLDFSETDSSYCF